MTAGGNTSISSQGNTSVTSQGKSSISGQQVELESGNSKTSMSQDTVKTEVKANDSTISSSMTAAGQQGMVMDKNGKISQGTVDQSTAAMTVTNANGSVNGVVVNQNSAAMTVTNTNGQVNGMVAGSSATSITGGNYSGTSLTLSDGGAHFGNASSGAPVVVSGVADGSGDFDAVNYRQLKQVAAGVAGAIAAANIPQLDQGKAFSVGVGVGHFFGQSSMAIGGTMRIHDSGVIKASVSTQGKSRSTSYGMGAGWSW